MQTPVRITFRHMSVSTAAEENIRAHIAHLEQHFDNLLSCHVVIDTPPAHRSHGAAFSVRVELTLPGREIFVSNESDQSEAHTNVYVAIRDTFAAAERQLDHFVRRRRGEVKNHSQSRTGLAE